MFDAQVCRSLLFVPAGNARYLASALRGGADVIQIDLEDAIAPDQKGAARLAAGQDVQQIAAAGRVAAVRVNMDPLLLEQDLDAVVGAEIAALTIPKVDSAATLIGLDEQVAALEVERGLSPGGIRLIAQIESAAGVLNARQIAQATPRLVAMGVGMEDLVTEIGGQVNADALYFPTMQVLYAAREAGVIPIGYLGSIAVYDDPETFRDWIRRAGALGFEGGFCIHPQQVEILNDELAPTQEEVAACRALVAAFEAHASRGQGVFVHQGQMVDKPVLERARKVLARWGKV
ncbi:MAG: CoA ester lyase [Candidatus Latescibacteria bacterium]|nr:CoA ester lyase [Candidatus Latescibacterota bacterium]